MDECRRNNKNSSQLLQCMSSFPPRMPPLCSAAMNGNVEQVEKLLISGNDVNSQTKGGMTALMLAAVFGHETVVKMLLKYGADTELKNAAGLRARDMIDTKTIHDDNLPFYDFNAHENDKEETNYQNAQLGNINHGGLLTRRKKTLPKINIQNNLTEFVTRTTSRSASPYHAPNFRYSPYPKNFLLHKAKTPTNICYEPTFQKVQNLSPNVAKFFGSVLQAEGSYLSSVINNETTIHPHLKRNSYLSNNTNTTGLCPILQNTLRKNELGHLGGLFERQEINSAIFVTMSNEDLKQIGVKNPKQRDKLLRIIEMSRSTN